MREIRDYSLEQEDVYNKGEQVERKSARYEGTPLLLVIQLTVSLLVICTILGLKFVGGSYFNTVQSWYNEHINDSIIVDGLKDYQESFNRKSLNVKDTSDRLVNTSQSVSNIEEPLPFNISVSLDIPVESGRITSRFGERSDPISGQKCMHLGLDIGSRENSCIYPVMPGKVEVARGNSSYGNYVVIDHGNNIKTLYAHCKEINVSVGDIVNRKQVIAYVGSTGKSTGNHLHIESIANGEKYNPEPFFKGVNV